MTYESLVQLSWSNHVLVRYLQPTKGVSPDIYIYNLFICLYLSIVLYSFTILWIFMVSGHCEGFKGGNGLNSNNKENCVGNCSPIDPWAAHRPRRGSMGAHLNGYVYNGGY